MRTRRRAPRTAMGAVNRVIQGFVEVLVRTRRDVATASAGTVRDAAVGQSLPFGLRQRLAADAGGDAEHVRSESRPLAPRRCQASPADAVPPPRWSRWSWSTSPCWSTTSGAATGGSPTAPRCRRSRRWRCQHHRGGPHPAADRAQHPLRAGRPWFPFVAAVGPVERVQGAPRRRPPRRLRARRDGVAVRLHRRRDRDPRPPPRERHADDARAVPRARRPDGGGDGVREPHRCAPGPTTCSSSRIAGVAGRRSRSSGR